MAVYTNINKRDVAYINKKFKIDKIIYFKGIKQGIENTNYLLKSKNNKFILTIFERRVSQKEIPFFMKLMDKLNNLKINCPKPLKNKSGNYLIRIKNKTACMVSFLEGKDKKKLNFRNCYDIGKIIAQIHLSSKLIFKNLSILENFLDLNFILFNSGFKFLMFMEFFLKSLIFL